MAHRYTPIIQQPFCCVPACVQMVLSRRDLPLFSQEEIGLELGLVAPKSGAKKPSAGWGTQVDKQKYSLNHFFEKRNIQLRETYFPISGIENAKEWAIAQIAKDNDILVCFNYGKLYSGRNYSGQGHVSVIDSIKESSIILIDPSLPKYSEVNLENLLKAVELHGEKNRSGFWLISAHK